MDIEFAAKAYFSEIRQELEESGRSHKALRVNHNEKIWLQQT